MQSDLAVRPPGLSIGANVTAHLSAPAVLVSWGELFDKITILRIKTERLNDPAKVANVRRELAVLEKAAADARHPELDALLDQMLAVNEALWQIEDDIRDKERDKEFGPDFIALARSVYHQNDRRAAIKREINRVLESSLVEEKSYQAY